MSCTIILQLAGCNKDGGNNGTGAIKTDAFVIMTDALDGVFNPFFSTTAADGSVAGMTQISMLTTGLTGSGDNLEVIPAWGEDEPVVVKDMMYTFDANEGTTGKGVTTYTFVIKNNVKFSDGHPLTMEDVLFNLYVYLDPVYTGSSTIYSTDILGLHEYRGQTFGADSSLDEEIVENANSAASTRVTELMLVFKAADQTSNKSDESYFADYNTMKTAIANWGLSAGYKNAVSSDPSSVTNAQLLADYENTLKLFKEELYRDFTAAQEAFDLTKEPYSNHPEFQDEIFRFMCYEGKVAIKYKKDPVTNKDIKTEIDTITKNYDTSITTKEGAVEYLYKQMSENSLLNILMYSGTANELFTKYSAEAKQAYLDSKINATECGSCGEAIVKGTKFCTKCGNSVLVIPNISGITSLAHTNNAPATVTIGNNVYKVATAHDANEVPTQADEYDVLQIKINGKDPKAIWNFAFTVAPQHYYAEGYEADIKKNNFGVDYNSTKFMTETIQSLRNVKLPMGAGAYKATDSNNSDTPDIGGFFTDNVVYFKANTYFETVGAGINNPKIDKVRYQVVSASNAINVLQTGKVHYITPQLTNNNLNLLDGLKSQGIKTVYADQLGYGYIGINAGKVKDIELRKAIMTAMDTKLALTYYKTGTASQIYWPMSEVSWAYPKDKNGNLNNDNKHNYPAVGEFDREAAKTQILDYMSQVGASEGDSRLKLNFVIAGSNLTDHPTYLTFQLAADLLNECGWDIQVIADSQALTKLSTGSLAVWAAAWGSSIDPDMYQVYHKNSTASSVLAWGYREILANSDGSYGEENDILDDLSEKIELARETDDKEKRKEYYEQAMGYILDLAVELPVYQRSVLYAYNSNVIDPASLPQSINAYTSPLEKLWEVEFAATSDTGATEDEGGMSTGAIIGIVVGVVAVVGGAGAAAFVVINKKKSSAAPMEIEEEDANEETTDNSENN